MTIRILLAQVDPIIGEHVISMLNDLGCKIIGSTVLNDKWNEDLEADIIVIYLRLNEKTNCIQCGLNFKLKFLREEHLYKYGFAELEFGQVSNNQTGLYIIPSEKLQNTSISIHKKPIFFPFPFTPWQFKMMLTQYFPCGFKGINCEFNWIH